jgi:hypothetical protein
VTCCVEVSFIDSDLLYRGSLLSDWNDMSTCERYNQKNVSDWNDMSTCERYNQENVSDWNDMSTCHSSQTHFSDYNVRR